MTRRNIPALIIVLAIFAFSICSIVFPLFGRHDMRLGLDLVGGTHLVYQAQFPEGATAEEKAKDMNRALYTIQNRIDKYGVTEPIIQKQEGERILVQLPGFTDIEEAKKLVEETGFLEFREVELNKEGNPVYLSDYLVNDHPEFFDKDEEDTRIFVDENDNPVAFLSQDEEGNLKYTDEKGNPINIEELKQGPIQLLSWIPARGDDNTQLTGSFLASATPNIATKATGAEAEVMIEWDTEGGVIFDQIAKRLYGRPYPSPQRALGIFLDKKLISFPQILEPVYHGSAVITGNFTVAEVEHLSNLLKSGALPMPLQKPPLYEEMVTATLGADFINKSILAGIIGIILVMLFMIIYYRLPGLLASIALVFYAALVLALFKLIPVTLTLAGIGGFILSIGMAVDANVLIFERMKEELRAGRTLGAAIEAGFNRAWSAIRDSNITTFIVCFILIAVGNTLAAGAPVKGFGLTLLIGVAVSMFTAIVVTRTFLRLFVGTPLAGKINLFRPYAGKE